MKKEKKNKKLAVKENKDSKKETKKKNLNNDQKSSVPDKKIKPVDVPELPPPDAVDRKIVTKLIADSATLYQNILVLPQHFNVDNHSYALFPAELKALAIIGQFTTINLTQLARQLGISKSAISKCTAKLLDKGLINKEKSAINTREVIFTLSTTGQAVFSQLDRVRAELFQPCDRIIGELSEPELNELHRIFSQLHASLQEILADNDE